MKHIKPVGAPPAALILHERQILDLNERAHSIHENAEHMLEVLEEAMADGTLTRAEYRHMRGHIALQRLLAHEQCSILRWAWASFMQIKRLVERYRAKVQETKKAARQSGLQNVHATQS